MQRPPGITGQGQDQGGSGGKDWRAAGRRLADSAEQGMGREGGGGRIGRNMDQPVPGRPGCRRGIGVVLEVAVPQGLRSGQGGAMRDLDLRRDVLFRQAEGRGQGAVSEHFPGGNGQPLGQFHLRLAETPVSVSALPPGMCMDIGGEMREHRPEQETQGGIEAELGPFQAPESHMGGKISPDGRIRNAQLDVMGPVPGVEKCAAGAGIVYFPPA